MHTILNNMLSSDNHVTHGVVWSGKDPRVENLIRRAPGKFGVIGCDLNEIASRSRLKPTDRLAPGSVTASDCGGNQ